MRRSVTDGCFWAGMMGFGEQFIQAFVLSLALGERAAALVATLPTLIGATLALATPWAVRKLGSHKRWTVWCAGLQAAAFIPLVVAALVGAMPAWLAFTVLGLYYFGGLGAGVAWSTWISSLVPAGERPHFFSFRNRMIWIVQLFSIFAAGFALERFGSSAFAARLNEYLPGTTPTLLAFALVLTIAGVCRGVSTYLLSRIGEPVPLPAGHRAVPIPELVSRLRHGPDARLIMYFLLVSMATNVSLGFLSPFVLGQSTLAQPKEYWALVMGAMMLGRIAVLFPLGDVIVRHGSRQIMMAAAVGITLVHALYLLTAPASGLIAELGRGLGPGWGAASRVLTEHPALVYVVGVQFVAGVLYAAFDLTSWLLLVRHTRDSERTSMITLCWFGFNVFGFLGTLVGTGVLSGFKVPGTGEPGTPTQFTYEGYMWVFGASTLARLLTLLPLFTWVRKLPEE